LYKIDVYFVKRDVQQNRRLFCSRSLLRDVRTSLKGDYEWSDTAKDTHTLTHTHHFLENGKTYGKRPVKKTR